MAKKEPFKPISLRMDEGLFAEIAAVARVERTSISDTIRDAIGKHIATRSSDPEFQKRVKKKIEEDIATAKRLTERPNGV